ncbi:TCP-1/cpn60 chaperonin family protein [Candidatus Woesearchaeota archaeon]|nr:TCP-1/cpn60 chaperonin family protein [Candidatus Woesearchaeota archaeon]
MTNQVQPIFILPEGTQRSSGKNAQRNNIMAAKLVAETVRTTLGPKGMDKMLVDSLGDITVTNDGVTILQEMNVEHPSAKMLVEIAKTQEQEVGDGTTTAVVLAGELLKKAEDLLEQEIHPTVVARGYRLATEKAMVILDGVSRAITDNDGLLLQQIAMTAMTGKGAETAKDHLAALTVQAVKQVLEKESGKIMIDADNIKVEKKIGGSIDDSELVQGMVIDKERVHTQMPRSIKKARVALVDSALEIKNTEIDAKIQITDPSQMQAFIEQEEKMIKNMVNKVLQSGATALFCQKGIDDIAQHYLAKAGVYAVRRVKKSDMESLSQATGAKVVTNLEDLSPSDLGMATVEEVKVGSDAMTFVKECLNPKAVTLLVRGGTDHIVDEVKRAVDDAIGDVISALRSGKVVAGAGATEIELARNLRSFSESLSGREQLAVRAFADAMEVIPRTLAENAGLDPIDVLAELKAAHDRGEKGTGIDVFSGRSMDSWKAGVIEPLKIKTQAVSSASEVSIMILRIDDVIASSSKQGMPSMPPGGHDMEM